MITNQPECADCGGACCDEKRLEFPVPRSWPPSRPVSLLLAQEVLRGMGLPDATALQVRVNEHGRTVIRTRCPRGIACDARKRPQACLMFPANYLDEDHTDAERAEVREFCALFRRLEEESDDL